jgi:hypothetical protein
MLAGPDLVSRLIGELHAATPEHKKAKDILRAARLTLLPTDNPHVASDLSKIKKGQPLSPILLVHGDLTTRLALQIAAATTGCARASTPTRTPTSRCSSPPQDDDLARGPISYCNSVVVIPMAPYVSKKRSSGVISQSRPRKGSRLALSRHPP